MKTYEKVISPEQSLLTKFLQTAVLSMIALSTLILVYVFYLIFFPPKVLVITSPVTPGITVAKMGDMMQVKMNYCKHVEAVSVIVRSLVGVDNHTPYVIPFAQVSSTAPVGCGVFFIPVMIPVGIPEGRYKVYISFEYQADPVRMIHQDFISKEFKIVK